MSYFIYSINSIKLLAFGCMVLYNKVYINSLLQKKQIRYYFYHLILKLTLRGLSEWLVACQGENEKGLGKVTRERAAMKCNHLYLCLQAVLCYKGNI